MSAADPIELARAAQSLFRAIETIRRELAELSGLSLTELRALTAIEVAGELHPSEVAAALGVGLSATTSIGDRLERRRLITRAPDPADRRRILLRPTTRGIDVSRRADEHFIARIAGAADGLDRAAIAQLTATMSTISARL